MSPAARVWLAGGAVALGVVASFALAITFSARRLRHERLPTGPDVVHVEVIAQQYSWEVRHAGRDGVLGTRDDVTLSNELRVPVGRAVVVHLKTRDVVHGLFLPAYGAFRDVVPGTEAPFWFRADGEGESAMVCSQLCGVGHAQMRGRVVALSAPAWRRWSEAR